VRMVEHAVQPVVDGETLVGLIQLDQSALQSFRRVEFFGEIIRLELKHSAKRGHPE
jgi:hypothetical protein